VGSGKIGQAGKFNLTVTKLIDEMSLSEN